ncbi:MAG: aldose epimerase family protein [Planctomycetota bacterium]
MSHTILQKDEFGVTADGIPVDRYTLKNANGTTVRLITFGATVTEMHVPDRNGRLDDVVLGFDRLEQYETESPYFGSTIGRVAFRITEGKFQLDGRPYQVSLNLGPHQLHGGVKGLSWVVWDAEPIDGAEGPAVKFTYRSPDGDQGFPGNLEVAVVFTLNDLNEMTIDYTATTDKPTPVNLTHHGYFNLAGAASGDVLGHVLELDADRYSETDEAIIPTGQLPPVEGTPFDFRKPTSLGARIDQVPGEARGYDLAYLLTRPGGSLAHVATMADPATGRVLQIDTTAPAMILYTGDYLDGTLRGKGGAVYHPRAAFCLEPGHLPDSVRHANFPSVILRPGETYRQTSVYRFSTR